MKNGERKFAERLKQAMKERWLRQVDLLSLCEPYLKQYGVKMSKSHISQYLSGRVEPSVQTLFVLSDALKVSDRWLMGYDSEAQENAWSEEKIMRKITVKEWKHITAGTTIPNGYSNGYCTAPSEPGLYTLYEIADDNNCHVGWEWVKE